MFDSFFKEKMAADTTDCIYASTLNSRKFRLTCDNELYKKGIDTILEHLRCWIVQDILQTTASNQPLESTLLFQIKDLDVKMLPYPIQKSTLLRCMEDTEINFSGSRLMDTVVRINIEVPMEVLETIKGKFLYSMVYGLPEKLGAVPYPKKSDWLQCLAEIPWCPFLVFIQQLFDSDDITDKLSKLTTAAKDNGITLKATAPNGDITG